MVRICVHLKFAEYAWKDFSSKPRGNRFQVECTTARISSNQLQRLRSAWLRPAQTINNASLLSPSASGARAGEASALCHWDQKSATWDSHLGDCAPVPPIPLGPRKFLESANSYLTQKVIAQLFGYSQSRLWSPGDLRCPFVHKLPLRFYTVQCTPSAKESESSTLQSPGSSPHGSHTRFHRVGRRGAKGARQEKSQKDSPFLPSGSGPLLFPDYPARR